MEELKFSIKSKSEMYDGPFEKDIITYKLQTKLGDVTWHENGKRGLNGNIGDTFTGLVLSPDGIPDYRNSKIKNTQTKLF